MRNQALKPRGLLAPEAPVGLVFYEQGTSRWQGKRALSRGTRVLFGCVSTFVSHDYTTEAFDLTSLRSTFWVYRSAQREHAFGSFTP